MKSIILVAFALVAIAAAAPTEEIKKPILIVSQSSEQQPDGSYSFGYETDDGSSRKETGVLKEALNEDNELQKVVVVSGSYTYLTKDGIPETINYYADETGFHAEGESIPKVPSRR